MIVELGESWPSSTTAEHCGSVGLCTGRSRVQILLPPNLFAAIRAEGKEITFSHCIGAVAVGEEEKMRKMEASFEVCNCVIIFSIVLTRE